VGNRSQKCAICSSSREVREAIETRLQQGVSLDQIAAESGFSRSGLSRHKRECQLRATLDQHRVPPAGSRVLTQWPNGSLSLAFDPSDPAGHDGGRPIEASEVKESDVIVSVQLHSARVLNPAGLRARLVKRDDGVIGCTFDPPDPAPAALPEALPPAPEPGPQVDPPSEVLTAVPAEPKTGQS
jgi:hypothetical protein